MHIQYTKYTFIIKNVCFSACGCVHYDDIEANEIMLVNQYWRRPKKIHQMKKNQKFLIFINQSRQCI